MKKRWLLAVIGGVAVALAVVGWVILHLPSVQRDLFDRVAEDVRASTGLSVEAGMVTARLWPARLQVEDLRIAGRRADFLVVERLEARWRWRGLLATPPRVDRLSAAGVVLDLAEMPVLPETAEEAADAPLDPWQLVEIGRLELSRGSASGDTEALSWRLDDLAVSGFLHPEGASLTAEAAGLEVVRAERSLALGRLRLAARADPERGLGVERFELVGTEVALEIQGASTLTEHPRGSLSGRLEVDPAQVVAWWDPDLLPDMGLAGRLELDVSAEIDGLEAVRFEVTHDGGPVRVAGLSIDRLRVAGGFDEVQAELSGGDWGQVTATWRSAGTVAASLVLEGARPAEVLGALGLPWPAELDRGLVVGGRVELASPLPGTLETLSGSVDLRASTAEGEAVVVASASEGVVAVERFELAVAGATVRGSGRGDRDGAIEGLLELSAPDLAALITTTREWLPEEVARLGLAGGVAGEVVFGGTVAAPSLEGAIAWTEPAVLDVVGQRLEVAFAGDRDVIDWSGELRLLDGLAVQGSGATGMGDFATTGTWAVAAADLSRLGELELPVEAPLLEGSISGEGDFSWTPEAWSADGRFEGATLGWQGWQIPAASVHFAAEQENLTLHDLSVELAGGRIAGNGELPLGVLHGSLQLDLAWLGIDLAQIPVTVPEEALGTVAGRLNLLGTLADPVGEADVEWTASAPEAQLIDHFRLLASLDGGVVRATSDDLVTDLGAVDLRVTAPLGDLPRPEWLLRGAPGGPVRASVRLDGVSSKQLLAAAGQAPAPVEASADLRLELEWLPPDLGGLVGELRVEGLRATSAYETFVAEAPLVVELRPGSITVLPFTLAAPKSRIELAGRYDLLTHEVDAAVTAELSADAARLLPVPAGARGDLKLVLEVRGPPDALDGRLMLDHRGGSLTLRDPALEITDLYVEAKVDRGVVSIEHGSAGVNRGRVEFGGGWDPDSDQGVVAELSNVVLLLPGGILTAWSGSLAVEPAPGQLARVVGELVLESGLWDSPFDLTSTVLGGGGLDVATDEMLYDIGLDLQVRGRRGVRVDNNLGDLEVNWSTLHVTGTAAEPIVRGDLKITPGGRLTFAGQEVTVRRGTIRMTGDPATDPQIEIVPEQDLASYEAGAEGGGESLGAQMLATKSLARGVGSALGFENESLEPAEISIETESASASSFSVGQRLTSSIALLLTTDLADTASRTTMIQLWNVSRLPGLALQVYESTQEEGTGANLIQSFRWGGSAPAEERPEIHRVKIEGEWPISDRRARKATGLTRGQPYDPFLVFAARVRLEKELAGDGYHLARVEGRAEGSERSPTLVFNCEPGPLTAVRFEGEVPPRRVRREVTALYQPPPLEGPAIAAMRNALLRYAWSKGHAAAEVEVERQGEAIVARTTLGPEAAFTGPFLHGFPPETEEAVRNLLATPTELAAALEAPERLERAVQRILRARGWQEAQVRSVTGKRGPDAEVEVHVELDPGPRERVADVRIVGADPLGLLSPEQLGLSPGDPLDRSALEQSLSSVRFAYAEAGYAEVQLHSGILPSEDGGWIVELELTAGQERRVAETRVVGLRHLSERVVREGLALAPGDVLQPSKVDQSVVAIGSFAPVERVDVRILPAAPGLDVVELEVTEKPRWMIEAGAGWSSERGSELRLGLRDDNLFHRGFGLNLRGRWQADEQLALLVLSLPPRPGSRWRFGSTLRYFEGPNPSEPESFDQTQYTVSLEATFERSASDALRGYYQIRRTDNTFVCDDPDDPFCTVQTIEVMESILGASLLRDRMDNLFDPRSGYTLSLDVSTNRPEVGSDLSDARALMGLGLAMEPLEDWTWAHRLQLGWAKGYGGAEINSERRFYAGGQGTIRGFDRDTVGPVDFGADFTLTPAGGAALIILNQEFRIPVWGPVRAAVFVDIGQVWDTWSEADLELAVGAGLGVRVSTPVGPIWADVAWPVANEGVLTSRGAKFYLGIGRPF